MREMKCPDCDTVIPGPYKIHKEHACPACEAVFVGFYDVDDRIVCLLMERRGVEQKVKQTWNARHTAIRISQ